MIGSESEPRVVALFKEIGADGLPVPDPTIVEFLEQALEAARDGQIQFLATVYGADNNSSKYFRCIATGINRPMVLGTLRLMEHELVRDLTAGDEK